MAVSVVGGGGGGGGGGGVATGVDEDPPPPPHATKNVVESKREKTVRKFFMPLVKRKRCKNTNHTILVSITRRDLSPEPECPFVQDNRTGKGNVLRSGTTHS